MFVPFGKPECVQILISSLAGVRIIITAFSVRTYTENVQFHRIFQTKHLNVFLQKIHLYILFEFYFCLSCANIFISLSLGRFNIPFRFYFEGNATVFWHNARTQFNSVQMAQKWMFKLLENSTMKMSNSLWYPI